jgi:16S rRNA pseudouridine516 synthase
MKLERLVSKFLECGRRRARARLAAGLVRVNGESETDGARLLGPFDRVEVEEMIIQSRAPRYVALHKPSGYVSATVDPEHPTVIQLIGAPWAAELHLAGRLDRFTTGLVILTNDSRFSEGLTLPGRKVPKVYGVETDAPIPDDALAAFEEGMRFAKENITTEPALVARLGDRHCRLTIYEGKHHQVKRMFARFGIKVVRLHREAVGGISLEGLEEGEWRELEEGEVTRRGELPDGPEGFSQERV